MGCAASKAEGSSAASGPGSPGAAQPQRTSSRVSWTVIDVEPKSKEDGEEKRKLLEENADDIFYNIAQYEEKNEDDDPDDAELDEDDEDEDHKETEEEKLARKKNRFEAHKAKYKKWAEKGKVEKLEKKKAKYKKKVAKATEKGKSDEYISYKQSKVDFINTHIKLAQLISNMKKAGLM